ncbi:hypothetical protein [Lysinibacillus telephonicus]
MNILSLFKGSQKKKDCCDIQIIEIEEEKTNCCDGNSNEQCCTDENNKNN